MVPSTQYTAYAWVPAVRIVPYTCFMHEYQKLDAWKRGMALVEAVYRTTKSFPDTERYGLVSQMRRASVSIPSNIAEGAGRRTSKDFARFLTIAAGSCSEVATLIQVSKRLNLMQATAAATLEREAIEIRKMVNGLVRSQRGEI